MTKIHMLEDRFDSIITHLPWRHFLAPGVILLDDDDAMVAAIEYRGRDQSVMSDEDLDATSARVANLLRPFDAGGMTFHFEIQKRRIFGYPEGSGRHPVPAMIDDARRKRMNTRGVQYQFKTYL